MTGGKLPADVRRAAHVAVEARLARAQLATPSGVLARLVDGWLDDLDAILGGVTDAEIDPRFVEGVLVELRRS
ncbi:MAG: hypothetical protein KIT31_31380 [Deltaproteobacteria bacterium]|nr:hypothetical protein [Deltaproteobacteria bacterium]